MKPRAIGSDVIPARKKPASSSAPLSAILPVRPEILAARQQQAQLAAQQAAEAQKTPQAPAQPQPEPLHRDFQPPAAAERQRGFLKRLQMPAIITTGIIAGLLVQSAPVGQMLIGIYGLAALIFRIDSRTTFTLAFLAIASTVLIVILQHNSLLAQTFAGYTLLLFCIAVICAAREVRAQRALLSKKRRAERRY